MNQLKTMRKWNANHPTLKRNMDFILVYTVLFFIIFLFGYMPFFKNGASFIWEGDGMRQHYPALVYLGRYLRAFVKSVLSGSPTVPLYDFRIGLGDDVMAPLLTHSANIDSFSLLSLFTPFSKTEALYNAIVVLRIYFSGLAFAFFGKKVMHAKSWAILIGSFTYAFSGWAIFTAVRHPHFMIAMVYTPLLVTGLDLVLRNKKPHLFILSVFLSALTGYYFLYMESLFLLVYAFIRLNGLYQNQSVKMLFSYAVKTIGYYLVGVLMASVIFVPLVVAQLNSSRTNHVNVPNLLFYDFNHYMDVIITSISGMSFWDSFGMAAIVLIAFLLLFVKKTKYKKHFIMGTLIFLTVRLIPFGNLLFNGFGYVSTRWTFLLAFLFAFLLTYMLPHMLVMDRASAVACLALTAVYGFVGAFLYHGTQNPTMGLVFLGLTTLCLFLPHKKRFQKNAKTIALLFVVTINLIGNARFTFHYQFKENYYLEYQKATSIYSSSSIVSDYVDTPDSFYREKELDAPPNASMIQDFHGVTEYWSMMNPAYAAGMLEHENRQQRPLFWNIKGLDNRTAMNALASVKYITAKGNKKEWIPYGYEKIHKIKKEKKTIYTNPYALPIGYTYSNILSSDEYDRLDAVYKQEALLQAVVLKDTEDYVNTKIGSLKFHTTPIPYTVLERQNLEWENATLSVKQDGASLTLGYEGLPNSETYVRMVGFHNDELFETTVRFEGNHLKKTDTARFWQHAFYFGKHNYLTNLGYSEHAQNKVTLTFSNMGTYKLKDVQVYCYPMTDYPEQVEALREDVLENVAFKTNKVTGNVNLKTDKVLSLSIPYSKGWSAYVDGEKRELLKANTMYMALPLHAGRHTIELVYLTPGLMAGIVLSLFGMAAFLYTLRGVS